MDGLQPGRGGRGKPISRDRWPPPGAQRDWLAHCDEVHRENGFSSLRALGKEMHLAATRVGELLRGEGLPVDEEQARALLAALGATDGEIRKGVRLYRAARAELDQAVQAAGPPGWWLRSGYVRLVGDIAPLQLLGRDDELDELARWCASADEAYVRWQAGPQAGKSALMAWLVLHPPPGTWVVSFFVTARLAAQADSTAFTDSLLDQLAAVTGKQIPPDATAQMRDRLRRQLLEQAAECAVKAGRRLILVVDGLDEDCGSLPGSGLPSIAACLPKRPPAGLRVIVARRPDPPLPADVDPGHPLHRCPVRPLDVSPHATEVMQLAQRELDEVLATDRHRHDGLGYQVLGLVTASGGGLGDRDLQQLTGRPAFEIDRLLRGVFGRTIAGHADPHASARAFLFTHETLREQAIGRLGPDTLVGFAARLHTWADSYRHRGWPTDTPEYLLRGYPRMLNSVGDVNRLAALAGDPARHRRMLAATGGNAATLVEIVAAQTLISTSTSPDLLAALRLAWHRNQLTDRNACIPVELPAVWATLGQPVRAEALARSITNPDEKAWALGCLARAVAAGGDFDRARELAADAEQIARSITDLDIQALALGWVARAVAGAGDHDHTEQIARSITSPGMQARALSDVASSTADPVRARSWVAGALAAGRGTIPLQALARIDPAALSAFAHEMTASLQDPSGVPGNGLLSGTSRLRGPA
jgi:hypothetical protein